MKPDYAGNGTEGHQNGIAAASEFDYPNVLALDRADNLYVCDMSSTVRKISISGLVSYYTGLAQVKGYQDGVANEAQFGYITGIVVDRSGNVFVSDAGNNVIRKITP